MNGKITLSFRPRNTRASDTAKELHDAICGARSHLALRRIQAGVAEMISMPSSQPGPAIAACIRFHESGRPECCGEVTEGAPELTTLFASGTMAITQLKGLKNRVLRGVRTLLQSVFRIGHSEASVALKNDIELGPE